MAQAHKDFVHPEKIVSTEWVAEHLNDPSVRIVESNEDQLLYSSGHIPGSVEVDWVNDLNHPIRRDYLQEEGFQELASRIGITPETTVVFYGDKSNWWACYALWVFELFGHTKAKIMDGGRLKWEKESRPLTKDKPSIQGTDYPLPKRSEKAIRAYRDDVLAHLKVQGKLVDVRSPEEYRGERLHMPDYPNEGALRGGHIPGAKSVPWARAVNAADGSFLSQEQLAAIYQQECALSPQDEVIAYCRIGERSSHTWFVLKYLLGFENVRNYDGSWTEWGNLVNVPIEK
ncbi:MAG: sulfurtransferase [Bdellovibrionales bacterium]|nr:sulfurtransferase [Bdellovibrionales bacterium]